MMAEFAELLRSHRLRTAMTQEELAHRSGLSARAISAIENGHRTPRAGSVRLLAEALGLSSAETSLLISAAAQTRAESVPSVPHTHQDAQDAPRTLPHDVAGFVGRESDLAWLDHGMSAASTLALTAIVGAGGIGKTSLALRWAHRKAERFPDGQLFVNMRGHDDGRPLGPLEALAYLLRCLGVAADQLPTSTQEASARFRSLLAGKRMLLILDNVHTTEQVRPLLPGHASCQVLVTSRDRLSGLVAHDGARRLVLSLLPDEHGLVLLGRMLGRERIDAELDQAARIVARCAGLPLALRIAAAKLTDRPQLTLEAYAEQLAEGNRLDSLEVVGDENRGLRAVLDDSHRALPSAVQRVFGLLGAIPGPDFTVDAVAVLADLSRPQAQSAVDILAAAHLVDEPQPARYTLHDLVREYAQSRLDDPVRSALRRLLEYVRDMACGASSYIRAGQPAPHAAASTIRSTAEAMAWLEAEQANISACMVTAAHQGWAELAGEIATPMGQFFHKTGAASDWIRTFEAAAAALEPLGETKAKYFVLNSLGYALFSAGRLHDAIPLLERAIDGRRRLGDPGAAAGSQHNLASVYQHLGRLDEALVLEQNALAAARASGALEFVSVILSSGISNVYQRMGRFEEALECLLEAIELARQQASPFYISLTLNNLGWIYLRLKRLSLARRHLEEALELSRRISDRYTEPLVLTGLAQIHHLEGDLDQALALKLEAHAMMTASTHECETASYNDLGDLYRAAGQTADALHHYEIAGKLARERRQPSELGRCLTGLGRLLGSREHLEEALELLEPLSPVDAADARAALAALGE